MNLDEMKSCLEESRKREKSCARTLKGKALLVIDHLLSLNESDDPLLNQIYTIAHSATGVCQGDHKDWIDEIHKTYEKLVNRKEAPCGD